MSITINFQGHTPYDYAVRRLPDAGYGSFTTVRLSNKSGEVTFFVEKEHILAFKHTLTKILEEIQALEVAGGDHYDHN